MGLTGCQALGAQWPAGGDIGASALKELPFLVWERDDRLASNIGDAREDEAR